MKNVRIFYLKMFLFLVIKFSIYLNRRVFVMATTTCITGYFVSKVLVILNMVPKSVDT